MAIVKLYDRNKLTELRKFIHGWSYSKKRNENLYSLDEKIGRVYTVLPTPYSIHASVIIEAIGKEDFKKFIELAMSEPYFSMGKANRVSDIFIRLFSWDADNCSNGYWDNNYEKIKERITIYNRENGTRL